MARNEGQSGDREAGSTTGDADPVDDKQNTSPPGLPEDILPEALRGRPAAEVKKTLGAAFESLGRYSQENKKLEKELQSLRRDLETVKNPPKPKKPANERILDETEDVIHDVVTEHYGGAFENLQREVGEATFTSMAARLPDFEEYEDEVRQVLQEANAPLNRESIQAAYTYAVGKRALEERNRDTAERDNPAPVTQTPDEEPQAKLSDFQDTIRRGLGMDVDTYKKYMQEEFEIEVPT